MSIDRLITENFRNLTPSSIQFHPKLNIIVGDNGSGKSSLLEAIFYLGHGKSFRTTKAEHLLTYDCDHFVVSAKDDNEVQFGLSKNLVSGITSIKIDGENHKKLSSLVKNVAVQIVTPESFKLFFGGPKERRRFVDLGMFHVKHEFPTLWNDFARVLKQRNASLKARQSRKDLAYWTRVFSSASQSVALLREKYVLKLQEELNVILALLLPDIAKRVRVQYQQGWSTNKDLFDLLTTSYERELSYGYSVYGAHKFDVKFLLDNIPIENRLSRGQQKLFLLALTFAQAMLIEKVKRVKPILLIDDIGAELDANSRQLLSLAIDKMNCQVIITAIEEGMLSAFTHNTSKESRSEGNNFKMFHVKHGEVLPIMNQQ